MREFGLDVTWRDIQGVKKNIQPQGEVFPLSWAPIVRWDDQQLVIEKRIWGLFPPGFEPENYRERDAKQSDLFNAESQMLPIEPEWRVLYPRRRCVIPADYFYLTDSEGEVRFALPDDGLMFMPGLWNTYECKSLSQTYYTFAMITTDGRPVVFTERHEVEDYLDPGKTSDGQLQPLLSKTADDLLEWERVER